MMLLELVFYNKLQAPLYRRSVYRLSYLWVLLEIVIYEYVSIFYGCTILYRCSIDLQRSTGNKLLCICEEKSIFRISRQCSIISQNQWGGFSNEGEGSTFN